MSALIYGLAGLFLPLFPLSMAFNALLVWVRNGWLRAAVLLAWPQLGLTLLSATDAAVPSWIPPLALSTSALYAFRAIGVREVGQWVGYLGTSAWALLWLALPANTDASLMRLYALGFSFPLALLALLAARLERQFGAAYTGLYGGLAQTLPRFSGVLVFVVLAVIAVPLFPSFFAMLATIVAMTPVAPLMALAVAGIWVLWSWAGFGLLQGLLVGPTNDGAAPDLSSVTAWVYSAALTVLLMSGVYVTGDLV